ISGVVLTKLDGDTRGGAALSIKAVTDKPIKYVATGEKLDEIETFHPERMASRILGMGDVLTLIEKAQTNVDEKQAKQLEEKMSKNINIKEKQFIHVEAIIQSMTKQERQDPSIMNASRKKRIAKGSGTNVSQVNRLLKQFNEMKKMMKQMTNMQKGKKGKGKG